MRNSNINFNNVLKRKMCINSTCYGENPINIFNTARVSLKENKSTMNNDIIKFFNSCRNIKYANSYYNNCLSLIENTVDDTKNRIITVFSEEIIPYIKNLNSLKESVKSSSIDDDTKSILLNSIKENKICDRILSNDKMIKKRFNIENFINDNRYLPLENIVFECCSMIDTYDNIPSYGKMNISLEQLSFYLQKQDVKYDRLKFVELVTEYFLYRNINIDTSTKNKYINVLKENIMISNNDLNNIKYFVEEKEYMNNFDIKKIICNFTNSNYKDLERFKIELQGIFEKSPMIVISQCNFLLEFLRHLLFLGAYSLDCIQDIIMNISTRAMELKLNNKYISKLIHVYRMELEIVEKQINITGNENILQDYYNCISDCIDKLDDYMYRNSNFEFRNVDKVTRDNIVKTAPVMTLQEFKIFKFDNLIKATMKIDKMLRNKSVKITKSIKDKAKKVFKVTKDFFKEDADILNIGIITEDNSIDICLAIFEAKESEIQNIDLLMESLCNDIRNRILNDSKDLDIYYTNIGNIFELHLENNIFINLTEEQEQIKNNVISERDLFYINNIMTISESLEKINTIDIDNIIPSCIKLIETNNNIDYLQNIIEILSYTDIANKKDMINLKEYYSDIYPENYLNNSKLSSILEEYWNNRDIELPLEIQTEALELVNLILNEATEKKKVQSQKVKVQQPIKGKDKESSSSSLEEKINNMKLAMVGVKKKAKDLSSKEQELCRNVDATVSMLYRSMKQAAISDRREAIIKGSIIPNFSKLIKSAIALIAIGWITQPVYAVITAIVGLAVSKNLTKKERSLLLDEIDIELKVVDKEIQIAENSGNMRKYRKLITFQKKLQREKARIRYGVKVGRDLPDNPTNDY